MTTGILEVQLVGAKGLKNAEILVGGIDPYVLLQYKSQEHKSSIARAGKGSLPQWNQRFSFRVEYPATKTGHEHDNLILKVMDYDTFSADDCLGEATIYVEDLLQLGVENGNAELPVQKYRVVDKHKNYSGEIQVGVTFTPNKEQYEIGDEDFGGWKESSY